EGTVITSTLTRLNPEHVLPPRPEVVTIRVSYSPMLPSDQIKVHIIGTAGLGTPDIPSKPGIPEPGENYVSFTVANYFVGANLGMNCQVFYEVLRDHASTTSTELTLQVQDLPAQELDLVRIPEAVGDQVETNKAYTVRVDGWPFMRPGRAMWIDLLSSSNYALRISLPVSNEEFNARRISMPIPATYLRSLHEGDTLRVKVLASLDGTGNKSSAKPLETSPPYRVKRASGVIVGTITVGMEPTYLALSPDNTRLYVANVRSLTMSIVDTTTLTVITHINLQSTPTGLAVDSSGERIYVATSDRQVRAFDSDYFQVIASAGTLPSQSGPTANAAGNRLYMGIWWYSHPEDPRPAQYLVLTWNTSLEPIGTAYQNSSTPPTAITTNLLGNRLYVTGSNQTIVYDQATTTRLGTYSNQASTNALAYNPHEESLYVAVIGANNASGFINILDTRNDALTLYKSLPGFNRPWAVAFNPITERAYVTENSGNTVKVIDTSSREVITTISPFDQPKGIVVTTDGQRMFVANAGGNSVTVIDI
ncbi:YncE family protein, partial [Pseudomonas sp. MAFF 301449]